MKQALIIFTRVPAPGETKTRLMKVYTPEECATIHQAMLLDMQTLVSERWDLFVYYTPAGEEKEKTIKALLPGAVYYLPQKEVPFGQRMEEGFAEAFQRGYEKALLVGTDIPALDTKIIEQGFAMLDETDMVMGETEDAGYYIIGMKSAHPEVFSDQVYGTGSVFSDTMEKIRRIGATCSVLPTLCDIDEPEDIERYKSWFLEGKYQDKIHTKACLLQLGNEKGGKS